MCINSPTFKPASNKQSGFSLLESLVAILVMALGLLGILGMQVRTLINTQNSLYRTQAIRLIEDLSERLMLNPHSLLTYTNYLNNSTSTGVNNCETNPCTATEIALRDAAAWRNSVQNTLPAGQAQLFLASDETNTQNHRQLGVMVAWRENEASNDNNYRLPLSNLTGAGKEKCPAGLTCHLQFISLKARCTPYSSTGSHNFYCQ